MELKQFVIAGNDYELAWSLKVYKEFSDMAGIDFNHLRSSIFSEINYINDAIGKPPGYHAKGHTQSDYTVYYTESDYIKALSEYNSAFDLEFTKRVTEYVSLELAAKLLFVATRAANSKVTELSEMEENLFIEGIKPGDDRTGYQYLVVQYISWTYSLGGGQDTDEKKSSNPSLLKKLISSLTS